MSYFELIKIEYYGEDFSIVYVTSLVSTKND